MRKQLSHRDFIKMTGAGLAGASLVGATGCGGSASSGSSGGGMWKRFAGMTINFVSENTAPTSVVVVLAVRRYLVRGLTLGAVTGE